MRAKKEFWSLNPASILYFLILLFLPTQFGRHFWPDFSNVSGLRIDYLSPTTYVTDILIASLFILWFLPNFKKIRKLKISLPVPLMVFLIFLALGAFLSVSPASSLYGFLKLVEFSFFGFYTAKNIKNLRTVVAPLSIGVAFESLLTIAQYFNSGSLGGIFYFFGERFFNSQTPGIANASLSGSLVLRPYGTFSHPNVLAAYLTLSMSLIIFTYDKLSGNLKTIYSLVLILGTVALLLTFSRVAILAWVVALSFWIIRRFGKSLRLKIALPILITLLLFFSVSHVGVRFSELRLSDEAVSNRLLLSKSAFSMIWDKPILGTGLSNFLPNLPVYINSSGNVFYVQPVHNIFLLILAEMGIAGFLFFVWFSAKTYGRIVQNKKNRLLFIILLFEILILGFFDHYFLTLQQGQLLLALSFGLFWSDTI